MSETSTRRPQRYNSSPRSYHSSSRPQKRGQRTKQYINPSRFVQEAKASTAVAYEPVNTFDDFEVHPIIKRNIVHKGFTTPSHIQDVAIPHGLEGKDVVGIANTGTGKTTAFALPVLHRLMTDPGSSALIIAPTRELATQIEKEMRSFATGSGLFGALLIGGSNMGHQIRDLRSNPSIVIGTPGRIKDHVERGTLKLMHVNMVVLDEVDRMVDMGFITDIRFLLSQISPVRQSLFFSATMDHKIEGLVRSFLNDPVTVSVKTGETSENVHQNVIGHQGGQDKITKLHDLLIDPDVKKALIFDDTQRSVERLSNELLQRGFKADALHGGKSQGQRQRALDKFRNNQVNILVATDVAARGIDVADITHVINFSVPNSYDDYTHRIGRAGRAGRVGHALTFIDY